MTPLETRSLPGALWERIPSSWIDWDLSLQSQIDKGVDPTQSPWKQIQWMTESRQAMIFGLVCVAALTIRWGWRHHTRQTSWKTSSWIPLLVLMMGIGFSDLSSSRLKLWVGRLKPHVNFYNPALIPALSFPSNHAVNTAFVWTFLWVLSSPERRRQWDWYFSGALAFVLFIGVSRVLLGQHYPLDVLGGWIFGGILGILWAKIYRVCTFSAKRNSELPRQSNEKFTK